LASFASHAVSNCIKAIFIVFPVFNNSRISFYAHFALQGICADILWYPYNQKSHGRFRRQKYFSPQRRRRVDNRGKVAVITGGGQGIGKAVARRLLESGMKVVIAEIDEEAGRETVEEFRDRGEIMFISADIADEKAVQSMISGTIHRFRKLDALINNAAISINKPMSDLSLAEWNRVLSVNLTGAFLCSKYAAPYLRESNGVIINIASTRALMSGRIPKLTQLQKAGLLP
jgi:hypothetical protein